jgi:hypothetical protein
MEPQSMTNNHEVLDKPAAADVLPTTVTVTLAFAERMPTQRVIDAVTRVEGGRFGDVIGNQPFRVVAFRALLRDYPGRDLASLWLHAYDVEVEVEGVDPTSGGSPMLAPPSGVTGESTRTT